MSQKKKKKKKKSRVILLKITPKDVTKTCCNDKKESVWRLPAIPDHGLGQHIQSHEKVCIKSSL